MKEHDMEHWVQWKPAEDMQGRFFIRNVQMSSEGFIIELDSQDDKRRLKIRFENGVDAYRCTNESWAFDIFAVLDVKYGADFFVQYSFFEITNSLYAKSLALTSCGLSDLTKFRHFLLWVMMKSLMLWHDMNRRLR